MVEWGGLGVELLLTCSIFIKNRLDHKTILSYFTWRNRDVALPLLKVNHLKLYVLHCFLFTFLGLLISLVQIIRLKHNHYYVNSSNNRRTDPYNLKIHKYLKRLTISKSLHSQANKSIQQYRQVHKKG